MIKIDPFTTETKIRCASAFLFFGVICTGYLFRDMLNLVEFSVGSIQSGFIMYSFYPAIFFLLWSLFNRWYFMIPAMCSLFVVSFMSIGGATIYFEGFDPLIEWVFPFIGFVAEGLALTSFVMYVYSNYHVRKTMSKNEEK